MGLAAVGVCVSMAKQQCEKVTDSKQWMDFLLSIDPDNIYRGFD